MATPTLTPTSRTSAVVLPSGSTPAIAAAASFPFSVYTDDDFFLSGASATASFAGSSSLTILSGLAGVGLSGVVTLSGGLVAGSGFF